MNRTLALAAASAIALASCQVRETGNETASAETNAAAEDVFANATTDANTATQSPTATAAVEDDHQYGPAPDTLPPGAQLAVLHGNPNEKGPFVMRLRFPAGFSIPAHWHPVDETVTVISGNLTLGMGDKLDRSVGKALGPGGFIVTKARQNHYGFTDSGATIQVAAEGPFQITYVNPADDPRQKKSGE